MLKPPHSNFKGKVLSEFLYWERQFYSYEILFSLVRDRLFGGNIGPFMTFEHESPLYCLAFPATLRAKWQSVGGTVTEPTRKKWEGREEAGGEGN